MTGDYPQFAKSYAHEQLVEYFLVSEADQQFIAQFRGNINRTSVTITTWNVIDGNGAIV